VDCTSAEVYARMEAEQCTCGLAERPDPDCAWHDAEAYRMVVAQQERTP
jgi:hypothetical protein